MANYLIVPNSENAVPNITDIRTNGIEIFHSTSYTRYTIAPKLNELSGNHLNEYIGKVGYYRTSSLMYIVFGVLKNTISNRTPVLYYGDSNSTAIITVDNWSLDNTTQIWYFITAAGLSYTYPSDVTKFTTVSQVLNAMNDGIWTIQPEHTDPYNDGGTSTSGGGGGSFDDSTDVIQIPSYDPVELLNRGYANRGFVKVYLPTQAQVLSLSNYLWSSGIDTVLKKLYADPIQCIISLSMIPLVVTSTITGNIRIAHTDTEITDVMIAENQFVTLDCGTIDLDEFWGSYLDYSPYTKLSIYLPFIGVRALNIDEFMSGTIGVKYVIDIVSGDCIAFISRVGSTDNLTVPVPAILGVLYQFNGNVSLQVPISAANFAQMYGASISAAVGGVGMLAGAVTGGLSAPMAIAGIAATAVNVASAKPSISHGGAIPSTAGWLGVQKPYLILQRPQQCLPENQNTLTGYPAYITVTIGDVEGYNEFEIMHLENIPATEQEKDEIERLLKSGVIL